MIDPQNLMVPERVQSDQGSILTLSEIPEYDQDDYDLSSPKDFRKYLDDIKKEVRGSYEYRQMIRFLCDFSNMRRSGSFENLDSIDSKVKTEIHHTPFTLEDIVQIVYEKRNFYHENISIYMVAKEVMELHYKQIVGLYPLTQTEHELVHNGYLFIPTYLIYGRYDLFVSLYREFIEPEMMETLEHIEEYSKVAFNEEQQKALISQSNVYIDTSGAYSLPIFKNLKIAMSNRVDQIKQNAYMLPIFDEDVTTNPMDTKQEPVEALVFL